MSRHTGDERDGVRTVTADCSEGHVDWSSPSGAVRINLQSYSKAAAFEACFTAKSYFSTVKISLEDESTDSLRELVRLDNSSHVMRRELCFQSNRKPVVLYVEAQVGDWQAKTIGHFDLDYDIRRIFPKVKTIQVDEMEGWYYLITSIYEDNHSKPNKSDRSICLYRTLC